MLNNIGIKITLLVGLHFAACAELILYFPVAPETIGSRESFVNLLVADPGCCSIYVAYAHTVVSPSRVKRFGYISRETARGAIYERWQTIFPFGGRILDPTLNVQNEISIARSDD